MDPGEVPVIRNSGTLVSRNSGAYSIPRSHSSNIHSKFYDSQPSKFPRSYLNASSGDYHLSRNPSFQPFGDFESGLFFVEASSVSPLDLNRLFFNNPESSIEKLSTNLNAKQRKKVTWRVRTIRALIFANLILLIAVAFPAWILLLIQSYRSSKSAQARSCDASASPDRAMACAFYAHELYTYCAMLGLWTFGTILQHAFMTFGSWKIQKQAFTGLVAVWSVIFGVLGLVVFIYSVVHLILLRESFNWKYINQSGDLILWPKNTKLPLKNNVIAGLSLALGTSVIVTAFVGLWLMFMRQIMEYKLNLNDIGSSICGTNTGYSMDTPVNEGSGTDQSEDDEDGFVPILYEDGETGHYYENTINQPMGDYHETSTTNSQQNYANVMEMMAQLTKTMSSLSAQIDSIESRVANGSTVMLLPPGDIWDAKKQPSSSSP